MNIEIGQVWRDLDNVLWRVVLVKPKWIRVKSVNGRGAAIQTNPAWFAKWERTS